MSVCQSRDAQALIPLHSHCIQIPLASPCSRLLTPVPPPSIQIWHFRDAAATFKGFVLPLTQRAFQRRIERLKPVTQPMGENITTVDGKIVVM